MQVLLFYFIGARFLVEIFTNGEKKIIKKCTYHSKYNTLLVKLRFKKKIDKTELI